MREADIEVFLQRAKEKYPEAKPPDSNVRVAASKMREERSGQPPHSPEVDRFRFANDGQMISQFYAKCRLHVGGIADLLRVDCVLTIRATRKALMWLLLPGSTSSQ